MSIPILKKIVTYPDKIGNSINNYKFRNALFELIELARLGNKYLAENEPWKLIKTNPSRTETILNISLQIVYSLSILCEPFLPKTSKKICKLLNTDFSNWESAKQTNNVKVNSQIERAEHLFEIISDEQINNEINKLKA